MSGRRSTTAKGQAFETLALEHLTNQHGCRLVARNHRCPLGEIDLVVWDAEVLAFVEVRGRRTNAYGSPLQTITTAKMRRIVRAARHFMHTRWHGPWPSLRFDAVGVTLGKPPSIQWIRAAFDANGPIHH